MSSTIWFDRLSRTWMQRHHQLVTDRIVESTGRWLANAVRTAVVGVSVGLLADEGARASRACRRSVKSAGAQPVRGALRRPMKRCRVAQSRLTSRPQIWPAAAMRASAARFLHAFA
jgi:hypothetical protein